MAAFMDRYAGRAQVGVYDSRVPDADWVLRPLRSIARPLVLRPGRMRAVSQVIRRGKTEGTKAGYGRMPFR